jgi:hypothetical protein
MKCALGLSEPLLTLLCSGANHRPTAMADLGFFRMDPRRALWGLLAGVAALLDATGCSVLVDPGREQCATDGDCQARGAAFAGSVCRSSICQPDPVWSCLGSVMWPAQQPHKVTVTMTVRDLVTEVGTPDVSARLCRKLDPSCADPVAGDLRSDQDGTIVAEVDAGFDGYLEVSAADYMTGLYFFYPPVQDARRITVLPLIRPAVLAQLALVSGQQVVPERGHVLLAAYDCQGQTAAGVRLSNDRPDALTSGFYVVRKLPSTAATSTDSSGQGGFINLLPGTVNVSGELSSDRQVAYLSVLVRPGQITFTSLVPSPR